MVDSPNYAIAVKVGAALAGLTGSQVAQAAGLSRSAYARIEGGGAPSVENIAKIAKAIGRSETWLMSLAHGLMIEEDSEGRILSSVKV